MIPKISSGKLLTPKRRLLTPKGVMHQNRPTGTSSARRYEKKKEEKTGKLCYGNCKKKGKDLHLFGALSNMMLLLTSPVRTAGNQRVVVCASG